MLLLERLTDRTASDHRALLAHADVRIPLYVSSGVAAARALDTTGWWVEPLTLFEAASRRHARWAEQLAASQEVRAGALAGRARAMLVYGLEARLRTSRVAQAYARQAAQDRGCSTREVALDVVADNPYLRDTFTASRRDEFRSVALHPVTPATRWTNPIRERAGASRALRRLLVGRGRRRSPRAKATAPTAALFVQSQTYLRIFDPIRARLTAAGWRVRVFCYHEAQDRDADTLSFARAVRRAGALDSEPFDVPEWTLSEQLLQESPVSERWLKVALDGSWLTGWEQLVKHQRLLASERPDVVISYTIDAVGLGLQGAAASLGIPSLFINHGPQGPLWSSDDWFFGWSAHAMAGQACVAAHAAHTGLVPVGYPPYDAILARGVELAGTRPAVEVGQPASRPYLVLAFAEYGVPLWVHAFQRRLLQTVAEALPDDCFLVCKLHPAGEQERESCEHALAAVLPSDAFAVVGERQYTTPDLLAAADVAVAAERCMALTDAIVMGRPAIGLAFHEMPPGCNDLSHPARGPEFRKCARVVSDAVEMRAALLALTRDADARQALARHRRSYIEQFYVAADAGAAERVAQLVRHLAERGGPAGFVPAAGASLL